MNKILLEEDYSTKELTFNLLNGGFTLNPGKYGSYAIATGCGSGKTTIIKQLIGLKWHEGILYSAFTKDEVNSMYDWIVKNLVGYQNPTTGEILKLEDIIVLHSDSTADGVDNNLWRNSPSLIQDKKIILCTHHKLVNEPIELLIGSSFVSSKLVSPKYRALNGIGSSLPRQWILIDEGIEATPIKYNVDKVALALLGEVKTKVNKLIPDPNTGLCIAKSVDCDPFIVRKTNSFIDFQESLNIITKMFHLKPFLKAERCQLDKIRNESILGELFDEYNFYSNLNSDKINVTYGISSLSMNPMLTHVLMFDGTSDITLSTSNKFKVISYENKYSGDIKFTKIPFSLNRRIEGNKEKGQVDSLSKVIESRINESIDRIADIIKLNKKTLIFTWKNLKSDTSEINDDNDSEMIDNSSVLKSSTISYINPDFEYLNYIRFELYRKGFTDNQFAIEYYGSGKDKATNEFREYDSVVLLGKYQVPGYVISDFNLDYHTNITGVEYYSNRIVQAICRTRIRLHQNLPVNVYYTSDWNEDAIKFTMKYLGVKSEDLLIRSDQRKDIEYMYSELRKIGITPKKAEQIAKLGMLDKCIYLSVIKGETYSCSVKLDELFELIPMTEKKPSRYSKMTDWIAKYGVRINII